MRRISIGLFLAVIMVLIPAWARVEAEVPGWENTLTQGAQNNSISNDLKLIAVGQDNAVFLLIILLYMNPLLPKARVFAS